MSQYKQIGNAVPVNLAEALGLRLVALLNAIETDYRPLTPTTSVTIVSP